MSRTPKLPVAIFVASAALCICTAALALASPSVTTGHASSITSSSAVLNGSVSANGSSAHFRFDFGLTKAYGASIAPNQTINGTSPVAVKADATHLLPGTTYHFRLVATNGAGTSAGADRTFKTAGNPPPAAATGPATSVGTTVATVTGVINPHNEATSYVFQYGISTAYGVETFRRTVPAGSKPVTVTFPLSGLGPATLYHYRLVALHGSSVVHDGADATFFTEPTHRPKPTVSARIKPHHARSAPFVFAVKGFLAGVARFPQFAACNGDVAVRFFGRHRLVGAAAVPVATNCTFAGQALFSRLPRHSGGHRLRLRVVVRFPGNGYLAPAKTHVMHVTLG